ncbi:MAG: pseudaminic acid synthase [bacterium]|nr:pseudaminic acid synthase [bacterium]
MKLFDGNLAKNNSTFIIAELSANHLQDYDLAVKTIIAMKDSGADAVKLQTYTADIITLNCHNNYFKIKQGTIWDGETLYDLYKRAFTPWEWQPKLKKVAEGLGLIFFSSPFDKTAVDFLEDLDIPFYKIASFEITDIPLIKYVASKKKPVILATGVAELADIELAIATCKEVGNKNIILLKCVSSYPTPLEDMNLMTIPDMRNRFNLPIGLSDHSLGITAPVVAVSLGAEIIEKHFILDKSLGGPDAQFSLEPSEFKEMVKGVRAAEEMLGKINYKLTDNLKKSREFCKSIFVSKDIKKGGILTKNNIKVVRPGYGMHPKFYQEVLGKRVIKDMKMGEPLSEEVLDKNNVVIR